MRLSEALVCFRASGDNFLRSITRGQKSAKKKFTLLGRNRDRIFEKTRVGFGRTELSLRLSCTEFCALSSGHGPRGQGFEGFCKTLDFHDFFWGSKMGKNMKMQYEHGQILVSGALDPRKMIS